MSSKSFCVFLLVVSSLLSVGGDTSFDIKKMCGPTKVDLRRPFKVLLTVYDSINNDMEGGEFTCTGKRLRKGMIAADLRYFPLGTKLFFDGMWHVVADVGDAIRGLRIDKFVPGCHSNPNLLRKEWVMVRMEIK